MIHPIYNKPELARRYYKEKTGEDLENELARKRFWADKKINKKILLKVLRQAIKEQITTYDFKKTKADSLQ